MTIVPLPVSRAPEAIAEYVEHAVAENGPESWVEITWYFRHATPADVHAFADEATRHLIMRDLWLQDPRHASDLAHEVITADLYAYGEARAAAEDVALHDLIAAWVRGHDLTAVSS